VQDPTPAAPAPRPALVDVDDAATAVIFGTTGRRSIALDELGDVTTWLQHTRHLMGQLRQDDDPPADT
jgi:hypothetical protein